MIERLLHGAVGEGGQGRGDPLQRPQPVEVAQADQQRLPPPGAAQAGHQAGALVERHGVLLGAQPVQRRARGPAPAAGAARAGSVHKASPRNGLPAKIPPSSASSRSSAARMNAASAGIGRGLGQMAPALQPALGQRPGRRGVAEAGCREAQRSWLLEALAAQEQEDRLRGHPRSTPVRSRRRAACLVPSGRRWCCHADAPRPEPRCERLLKILLGLCLVLAVGAAARCCGGSTRGRFRSPSCSPCCSTSIDRGSPYSVSFTDPELVWLREQDAVGSGGPQRRGADPGGRAGRGGAVGPGHRRGAAAGAGAAFAAGRCRAGSARDPVDAATRTASSSCASISGIAAIPLGEAAGGGGLGALLGETGEVDDPRLDEPAAGPRHRTVPAVRGRGDR